MVNPTYAAPAHPIGYIEVHSSWEAGTKSPDEINTHIEELSAKTLREQPGLRRHGARMEYAAGRANVYLGFAPIHAPAEPLDPHNLNNAPMPQPGMIEPSDGITPLGYKEAQFGRGT